MRARLLAARVAVTLGVGLLAVPLVAIAGSQAGPLHARLRATPDVIPAGSAVLLDASRSRVRGAHIVAYRWDLDGDGKFEKGTGKEARLLDVVTEPGVHRLAVKVRDDRGDVSIKRVTVKALPAPVAERAIGTRLPAISSTSSARTTSVRLTPDTVSAIRRGLALAATTSPSGSSQTAPLHAASATTVGISNFKFVPSSVTVHVGDTVTWVNHDTAAHTATASGTFDTNQLTQGQSKSVPFNSAGTFNYICSIHPYMKGTVTVLASSSGGSGSTGSSSGSSTSSNGSSSPSGSSSSSSNPLPHTGLQVLSLIVAGLALLSLGLVLRRGVRYPTGGAG